MAGLGKWILTGFLLSIPVCGDWNSDDDWGVRAYVEGLPVSSALEGEEIEALTVFVQSVRILKERSGEGWARVRTSTSKPLIFIRTCGSEIPRICRKNGGCIIPDCADRWNELPGVLELSAKDSCGFKGYVGRRHIFIRRCKGMEPWAVLTSLIRHEYLHEFTGLDNGERLHGMEQELKTEMDQLYGETGGENAKEFECVSVGEVFTLR